MVFGLRGLNLFIGICIVLSSLCCKATKEADVESLQICNQILLPPYHKNVLIEIPKDIEVQLTPLLDLLEKETEAILDFKKGSVYLEVQPALSILMREANTALFKTLKSLQNHPFYDGAIDAFFKAEAYFNAHEEIMVYPMGSSFPIKDHNFNFNLEHGQKVTFFEMSFLMTDVYLKLLKHYGFINKLAYSTKAIHLAELAVADADLAKISMFKPYINFAKNNLPTETWTNYEIAGYMFGKTYLNLLEDSLMNYVRGDAEPLHLRLRWGQILKEAIEHIHKDDLLRAPFINEEMRISSNLERIYSLGRDLFGMNEYDIETLIDKISRAFLVHEITNTEAEYLLYYLIRDKRFSEGQIKILDIYQQEGLLPNLEKKRNVDKNQNIGGTF